jgi:DNA-binding MarR family transcriptional regulator
MMTSSLQKRSDDPLARLDASLIRLRRFWQRPGVRGFLRARLEPAVDGAAYRALLAIESQPDASIGTVAEVLEIDASTASRIVERVVDGGYVRRSESARDRRRSILHLTDTGHSALQILRDARLALLQQLTDDWPSEDVHQLGALLERLDEACVRLEQA